jgi:hypothetical protein
MKDFGRYSIDELGLLLSDYHQLVYNTPITQEGIFLSREGMEAAINEIDQHVYDLMESFDGRESLRERGLWVEENAPRLVQRAHELNIVRKCRAKFNTGG